MKKLIILFVIGFTTSISALAQIGDLYFSDSINFEADQNSWLRIDASQPGSIWTIGIPSKTFFNSAYTVPNAIFTDAGQNYPVGSYSYFDLVVDDSTGFGWYNIGEGKLSLFHKYDTDTLQDGGFIEVSYDGGGSWVNIINDSSDLIMMIPTNFYLNSDTIAGGIPAFSGNSGGWQYSEIYWFWIALVKTWPIDSLMIRFTFQSDSVENPREGWMIDHIVFNGYEIMGGINETNGGDFMYINPNPASTYIDIRLPGNESRNPVMTSIYNSLGKQIHEYYSERINSGLRLDISSLPPGLYYVNVMHADKPFTGRILISR